MRSATAKKTYNLPPKLLSRAKKILGARTETQAVIQSLQEVVFMDDVEKAVRQTAKKLPRFTPLR
jgi:hypothetical protein